MHSESKFLLCGSRSGKNFSLGVERIVAASDEEILNLRRVVAYMAQDMRDMYRELKFFNAAHEIWRNRSTSNMICDAQEFGALALNLKPVLILSCAEMRGK